MSCKRCWKNPCCCGAGCNDHEPNTCVTENHGPRHGHPCKKCNHNPCHCACPTNSVKCETLPSQIENFTKQFFGTVVKTEVDGKVVWTLPCDLDTGLENNPRMADEGLACYFRRLFEQGIVGLTGPEGQAGPPGEDGRNSYTVTLQSFVQPTPENPNSQVLTAYNPAIFEGLTVFIQTSGYHFINATDGNGTLFLTLIQAAAGAPAVITAGKLVTATGPQGTGPQGQQGVQGPPGDQGPPGENFSVTNGQFHTETGTNHDVAFPIFTPVIFGGSATAEVTLPVAGKYMLTAVVQYLGKTGVLASDVLGLVLQDTILGNVEGTLQEQSNIADTERGSITLHALFETDTNSHQVRLNARCTTAGVIDIVADNTVITFVRIA